MGMDASVSAIREFTVAGAVGIAAGAAGGSKDVVVDATSRCGLDLAGVVGDIEDVVAAQAPSLPGTDIDHRTAKRRVLLDASR